MQIAGEPERSHSIENAEIHHFRPATFVRGHLGRELSENRSRGQRMNIHPVVIRLYKLFIAGKMRKHPQFYLRIVRGKNHVFLFARNERRPDLFPFLGTDRDVLQIRFAARESPRRRPPLHKVRVDPMGFLVHKRRKDFDIRILQLFQFAVIQYRFDECGFLFGKFEFV